MAKPAQAKYTPTRMLANYLFSFGVEKGHFIEVEACCDPITSNLYDAVQEGEVPETAAFRS